MSDDLVKRHRDECEFKFAPLDVCNCVEKNMADRIEELEAKLAKAVGALEFYATKDVTYPNVGTVTFQGHDDGGKKASATLAELKGKTDAPT